MDWRNQHTDCSVYSISSVCSSRKSNGDGYGRGEALLPERHNLPTSSTWDRPLYAWIQIQIQIRHKYRYKYRHKYSHPMYEYTKNTDTHRKQIQVQIQIQIQTKMQIQIQAQISHFSLLCMNPPSSHMCAVHTFLWHLNSLCRPQWSTTAARCHK